jgi:hypothetical protein
MCLIEYMSMRELPVTALASTLELCESITGLPLETKTERYFQVLMIFCRMIEPGIYNARSARRVRGLYIGLMRAEY